MERIVERIEARGPLAPWRQRSAHRAGPRTWPRGTSRESNITSRYSAAIELIIVKQVHPLDLPSNVSGTPTLVRRMRAEFRVRSKIPFSISAFFSEAPVCGHTPSIVPAWGSAILLFAHNAACYL